MKSTLVSMTAHDLGLNIPDVNNTITQYTQWVLNQLASVSSTTQPYLGIVELSNDTVNYGLSERMTFTQQVHEFCHSLNLDFPHIMSILQSYRNAVIDTLISQRSVTLYKVGLLRISEQGTLRFWSSCSHARKGTPLHSTVNLDFRNKFNDLNKAVA